MPKPPRKTPKQSPEEPIDPAIGSLSPRQREVLALIGLGLTDAQIARQLGISVRTVESHRGEIRKAPGIKTTADLYRVALAWAKLWKPE